MAVNVGLFYSDAYFAVDAYPGEDRERVEDPPPGVDLGPKSPWVFEWDADRLDRGEHEFLGLTAFGLATLTDEDLSALARVPLPRVSCAAAGLSDVSLVDVIRWAKHGLRGRGGQTWGWPDTLGGMPRRASA